MSRKARTLTWITALAAVLGLALAFAPIARSAASKTETPPPSDELQVVETSEVCMVNDVFFARPQIPVEVEGKTYYGCCQACEQRLAEDAGIRRAVDPVTGEAVDKATALIAARPDGSVLYFADEKSLERYRQDEAGSGR